MQPFVDFIIALFLAGIGCLLVGYLLWVLVFALAHFRNKGAGSIQYRRATKRVEVADKLMTENRHPEALQELRKAVLLGVFYNPNLIEALKEHHQNILSRCLIISEESNSRIENIADVERLFLERTELLSLLSTAQESFGRITKRREMAGKSTPDWSKKDYKKRIGEIKKQLLDNQKKLREELKSLFVLKKASVEDSVTYH